MLDPTVLSLFESHMSVKRYVQTNCKRLFCIFEKYYCELPELLNNYSSTTNQYKPLLLIGSLIQYVYQITLGGFVLIQCCCVDFVVVVVVEDCCEIEICPTFENSQLRQ